MALAPLAKRRLDLAALAKEGVRYLAVSLCAETSECASVCLETNGHPKGVQLDVEGADSESFVLDWGPPSDTIRRSYRDPQDATERGAIAVAFLVVSAMTSYHFIEQSCKGTGFDYWLGDEPNDVLRRKARLEVSGLLREDKGNTVNARRSTKLLQTKRSDLSSPGLPALVVIVDFGKPRAVLAKR